MAYIGLLLLASVYLAASQKAIEDLEVLEDTLDMEKDKAAGEVCTLTDFCKDQGMFKADTATYHVNDFCQTRQQEACGKVVDEKTGKRLCAMYGNYAMCNLPGDKKCDGLLTKDKIVQLCGEDRTPAEDKDVCSLKDFCKGSPTNAGTNEYCTGLGNACSTPNDKGNGLRLCRQYALYAECTIGNCDGKLGTDEVGKICSAFDLEKAEEKAEESQLEAPPVPAETPGAQQEPPPQSKQQ